jgi:hypothetical protein
LLAVVKVEYKMMGDLQVVVPEVLAVVALVQLFSHQHL